MSYLRGALASLFLCLWILSNSSHAETTKQGPSPDHFYNAPENLNPDPSYLPGDYALPETFAAKTLYQIKKSEMISEFGVGEGESALTLGIGDISATSMKNEVAPVTGFFRNYIGAAKLNETGLEKVQVLIDINSFDTAVPGRNNRILAIFFESMNPDFGSAVVTFDTFDLLGVSWSEMKNGKPHPLLASGNLSLNGVTQPIQAQLEILKSRNTWNVQSVEPIQIFIPDFAFGERVFDLMKECNHQSIGKTADVKVSLYFRE